MLALSVLASACGGVEREPNLARASERTTETGSFRAEIRVDGVDAGETFAMRCDAAFDLEGKRAQITCESSPEIRGGWEAIYVGDYEYYKVPGEGGWHATQTSSGGDSPFGDDVSPEGLLETLRAASSETERIGEEEVRGDATVRYRMTVRCEESGFCSEETGQVDVWIDDDGLVRRLQIQETGTTNAVELFDFGATLDIEPPPADRVTKDPPQSDPQPCLPGDERPIRVQQAIDVLGRHGFEMERGGFGCGPGVAGAISSDFEPVFLSCFVLTGPTSTSGTLTISPGPKQVVRDLENLNCTLSFERRHEEAVARLDAAFAELKRAIRP